MTLVVCLKASNGIVLAADSRGTIGDPRGLTAINDSQLKIFGLGKCGLALAGASEMGSALLDELRKNNLDTSANIDDAVKNVVELSATLFSQWFRDIPAPQRPPVLITLAGYRYPKDALPVGMIYLLSSQMNFAPQLFDHGPCMSGVPQYAVYLAHRYYDASVPLSKAKALAEYLITETASQDPKVGGPIRIAEITPEGGYRQLTGAEVGAISKANEELNERLRQFFLEGEVK
jgi:20S proteasome alpha/beta subunit